MIYQEPYFPVISPHLTDRERVNAGLDLPATPEFMRISAKAGEEPPTLDQWARDHGEPEHVGPQARMIRYGNGYEDRDEDEEDDEGGED